MPNQNRPLPALAARIERTFMPAEPLTTETPAPIWLVAVALALCPACYFVGAAIIGGMFAGVTMEAQGIADRYPPGKLEARATYLQIANLYTQAEARATGSVPGFRPGDIAEDESRIQADTWHAEADAIGEEIGDL